MTVDSVKIGADPEVLKVGLSDGSFFTIRVSYLATSASRPHVGLSLTEDALSLIRAAADAYAAETTALRLISLREHSRFMLRLKLRRHEFSEVSIALVLDRLEQLGFLDDERFSELWVESRVSSKLEGRAKLLAGLLARGVRRDVAEKVLRRVLVEDAEIEAARKLWEKVRNAPSVSEEAAQRKLRASGFSSKIIRAVFHPDD